MKLQNQPFQVLALLARRSGELVTREELKQAVWPADTFVAFDDGLNTAIKKIRQALRDSPDAPEYIETVPRRGYRFIATPLEDPSARAATRIPRQQLPAVVAVIAVLVVAVWLLTRVRPTAPREIVPVPLTTYPGEEWSSSFSPDGMRVAFRWQRPEQDHGDIFIKQIGDYEPLQLTHNGRENVCPTWSPDGRSIAFLRVDNGPKLAVVLIPAIGGPERKLTETVPPDFAACVSWDTTGRQLIFSDANSAAHSGGLFTVTADTGEVSRLTTAPQPAGMDLSPAISPNGKLVAFARGVTSDSSDLYLIRVSDNLQADGAPRRVTFDNRMTTDPAWTPDGSTIVFTSGTIHSPSLYSIAVTASSLTASRPKRLAFAGYGVRRPSISRQGRLAYGAMIADADIWRLELDQRGSRGKSAIKLIASTRLDHTPQYSPAGDRIAFASDRSGSHEIWVAGSDGSNARRLTSFGEPYTADPYWSPDGHYILFDSRQGGQFSAYVINADGGPPNRVTPPGFDASGWSRDGQWVYTSGSGQVWKFPVGGGQPVQITKSGGSRGTESADGRSVYFVKGTKGQMGSIWRVPAQGGAEAEVVASVAAQYFAATPLGLYFFSGWDHPCINLFRFDNDETECVATIPGGIAWGMSVSPDRHFLLYSMTEDRGTDLWLVDHFWR